MAIVTCTDHLMSVFWGPVAVDRGKSHTHTHSHTCTHIVTAYTHTHTHTHNEYMHAMTATGVCE